MRAAALANKNHSSLQPKLSVIQGVYQKTSAELEQEEISRAFDAASEANSIFPGTVYGISFFNLFALDEESLAKLLDAYSQNRRKASSLNLKIGTRLHHCKEILQNGTIYSEQLKKIALASDFVLCSIFPQYPDIYSGPEYAAEQIGDLFLKSRSVLLEINPKLRIFNGETGWPSKGVSYNKGNASINTMNNTYRFWRAMNDWAHINQMPVVLFEAFDEPWKSKPSELDPSAPGGRYGSEGHYGWWKLLNNSDPSSLVEKYLGM
jgi:exo-beta-1,3-glucanase (GH17 family)